MDESLQRRNFLKLAGGTLATLAAISIPGCGNATTSWLDQEASSPMAERPDLDKFRNGTAKTDPAQKPEASAQKPVASSRSVAAISRTNWGARTANASRMKAMGTIQYITIHHEGNPKPNVDSTPAQVAQTLRNIQQAHAARMSAGDIGYHYVVDRGGRVWEGRSLRYQGAHVSKYNPHNIGIMLLGNFDLQTPTSQQMQTLQQLSRALAGGYGIPGSRVMCHGELASTRCPGQNLRVYMNRLRSQIA